MTSCLGTLLLLLAAYAALRYLRRPSKIVFLLRKFDKPWGEAVLLRGLIIRSCRWVAVPITLQDKGILGDLSKGLIPISCGVLIAIGLFTLVISPLLLLASPRTFEIVFPLLQLLGVILFAKMGLGATRRFLGRFGSYQLMHPRKALRTADRALRRLRRPPLLISLAGMPVLRSSATFWRRVVLFLLRRVDCVLVDMTAASGSLFWEVVAASTILGPRKVVILHQRTYESDARAEIEPALGACLGAGLSSQLNWFAYSAPLTRSAIKENAAKLTPIVRRCLAAPAESLPGGVLLRRRIADEGMPGSRAPLPADGALEIFCGRCGFHFWGQPALTFFGFQRLRCPACSSELRLPLTNLHLGVYAGVLGLVLSALLDNPNDPEILLGCVILSLPLAVLLAFDAVVRHRSARVVSEISKKDGGR